MARATQARARRGARGEPAGPARRRSRQQLAPEARARILKAAAEVVGREGYAGASISKITERAGMAQGTFYLYFDSRQALFDELLPHLGLEMFAYVGQRLKGARSFFEMEERGFRSFFEFLRANPGFFTILNEAEVAAPAGYERHFQNLSGRYLKALERAVEAGEIRNYRGRELEALAYMLIATRSYMYLRYVKNVKGQGALPGWVVQTYMKLIRQGIS